MAGTTHVAVLLLLLADVVQLQTTVAPSADGAHRTVDDDAILKALEAAQATVEASLENIRLYDEPHMSILVMAPEGASTSTSTMSASEWMGFFRQGDGETAEALQAGETWQVAAQSLNIAGVEDNDGEFKQAVQLSESQYELISKKIDRPARPCPANDAYRSVTGICNNRKTLHLGEANRAFARWLPAVYEDGVGRPQGWKKGKKHNGYPLPLPRAVSKTIAHYSRKDEVLDQQLSQMVMVWGQFIEHDLGFSPQGVLSECGRTSCENEANHFPVLIPSDDPTDNGGRQCMQFVRTGAAAPTGTSMTRQQLNAVTSFIDGSAVYGSEECQAESLRNTASPLGLLHVSTSLNDSGRAYMPFFDEVENFCPAGAACAAPNPCPFHNAQKAVSCFVGGDRRVNQNLPLLSTNTLFLREHNRVATELKSRNPQWDGEMLFQMARKITVALLQMITYGEYLPLILGESAKQELPLYDTYDEKEDPSIANVISIAFRPPQRTIPTSVYLLNNRYETTKKLDFSDTLFSTWMAVEGGLDPIFRGVMVNAAKMVTQDAMASDEVRDKPFVRVNSLASGLDLVASNIQRNRDHGLPRYNAWRKFCGLSQPRNLDELARVLKNQELARKILDLYNTTANIDLWVGAISEPFVKNGRVGPLQACLIGQQFKKLRDGDRYWWQNAGVFTKKQREALSTTSLARVLCDNTGLQDVPINVFKANEYPRDFERCSTLKKLDLSAWAEDKS